MLHQEPRKGITSNLLVCLTYTALYGQSISQLSVWTDTQYRAHDICSCDNSRRMSWCCILHNNDPIHWKVELCCVEELPQISLAAVLWWRSRIQIMLSPPETLLINKSFAKEALLLSGPSVLSCRKSICVSPAANVSGGHLLQYNPHVMSSLCVCRWTLQR